MGTGALSLGVKRQGHEANHSLPFVPRSRMRGTIPPLPQYAFLAWCSVKKAQGRLYHYYYYYYYYYSSYYYYYYYYYYYLQRLYVHARPV
jgi:hypothetical protein